MGEHLWVAQFHYETKVPNTGFAEQDPEIIWQAFIKCISSQVANQNTQPFAITLSSAMHSLIPVDKNGDALADMITWADGRSADIALRINQSAKGETIYRTTGTPIHAMSPLCKIIWLRENKHDLFEKTYKFISIKEFIWFRLFREFRVDVSIACATGLFDIIKNVWNKESLELAEITEAKLSTPVSCSYTNSSISPSSQKLFNLSAEVQFIIGSSDGCFANIGSNTLQQHRAAVTIGTSGAVRLTSKVPIYNYGAMSFNYKLDDDTFVCGGAINNAGNVLDWFIKNFLKNELNAESYIRLYEEIEKVTPGTGKLIFLPYLNGERAPHWDSKSCGTFFGIKSHHTTMDMAKAVVEGICYALFEVLQALESNKNISQLNVSGGFTSSDVLLQILADVTGKRICITNIPDASAMGAAFFGLKQLKLVSDYPTFFKKENPIFFDPSTQQHETYKQHFAIYKELYQNLKVTMHKLHQLNSK